MVAMHPVCTARDLKEFIKLPRSIYPPDSPWIQPPDSILLDYLNQRRNPFFRDGAGQAFLAKRGDKTVGRVLAHVWRRHHRLHGERAGYFGFFECADDPQVAAALLNKAAEFARDNNCEVLRGPFNMTAAQQAGMVTDGFDETPGVDMEYTPPWYPSLLEQAGFTPCFRMSTWRNDGIASLDPDKLLSEKQRVLGESGFSVRPMHSWHRVEDMELARELNNAAFLGNWGFVPITREEWVLQTGPVVPILDPALVLFAELHGVPVGVTLAVPDFNRIFRKTGGRLVHPAMLPLLHGPLLGAAVVILFAVRKEYQGLGVSRLLNAALVRALRRRGYRSLAITWIASDNTASLAQAKALKMRRLHELAMFERRL